MQISARKNTHVGVRGETHTPRNTHTVPAHTGIHAWRATTREQTHTQETHTHHFGSPVHRDAHLPEAHTHVHMKLTHTHTHKNPGSTHRHAQLAQTHTYACMETRTRKHINTHGARTRTHTHTHACADTHPGNPPTHKVPTHKHAHLATHIHTYVGMQTRTRNTETPSVLTHWQAHMTSQTTHLGTCKHTLPKHTPRHMVSGPQLGTLATCTRAHANTHTLDKHTRSPAQRHAQVSARASTHTRTHAHAHTHTPPERRVAHTPPSHTAHSQSRSADHSHLPPLTRPWNCPLWVGGVARDGVGPQRPRGTASSLVVPGRVGFAVLLTGGMHGTASQQCGAHFQEQRHSAKLRKGCHRSGTRSHQATTAPLARTLPRLCALP